MAQPAPAAAKPMSASEEAASALERAIAALRAGQVPASSTPFSFQPSPEPVFQAQPKRPSLLSNPNLSPKLSSERAPVRGLAQKPEAETPHVKGGGAHQPYSSAGGNLVDEEVKDVLRPMLREWLDENLERVISAALKEKREAAPKTKGEEPPPPPTYDPVDASVFASEELPAGSEGLVQVFLHQPHQRELIRSIAREADPSSLPRGGQRLIAEVVRGQKIEIVLEGRGLKVDEALQSVVWRGEPCMCQFTITVPATAAGKSFFPQVLILINSLPIGRLKFAVRVGSAEKATPLDLKDSRFSRYRHAFLSYASPDREMVLRGAQMLRSVGISYFNDLLQLEPGDRWERELYEEIDRSDVFLLFWSSHARASTWVRKEINYALARQSESDDQLPDIRPIILEGPPTPEPPDELRHLHFNDHLMHVLAALSPNRVG